MSACLLSYARTSHPVADYAASPQSDAGRFRNVRERPAMGLGNGLRVF